MTPKTRSWLVHLGMGALGAAAVPLFAYLGKQDYSSLGAYAVVVQFVVQQAAHAVNAYFDKQGAA